MSKEPGSSASRFCGDSEDSVYWPPWRTSACMQMNGDTTQPLAYPLCLSRLARRRWGRTTVSIRCIPEGLTRIDGLSYFKRTSGTDAHRRLCRFVILRSYKIKGKEKKTERTSFQTNGQICSPHTSQSSRINLTINLN